MNVPGPKQLIAYDRSEQWQCPSLRRQNTEVLGADAFQEHTATSERDPHIQPSGEARLRPVRCASHAERRCRFCRKDHLREIERSIQHGKLPYLLVSTSSDRA